MTLEHRQAILSRHLSRTCGGGLVVLLALVVGCAVTEPFTRIAPIDANSETNLVLAPISENSRNSRNVPVPAEPEKPFTRIAPIDANSEVTTVAAEGRSVSTPKGETVLFAWDRSASPEVVGYRLWYGPQSSVYTNSVAVGQVTGAALTNLFLPVFVAATAYDAAGLESPFSNEVQVRGWDTVVRINALTNTALDTNFVFSHTIFTATNPPSGFWKLEAVATRLAR